MYRNPCSVLPAQIPQSTVIYCLVSGLPSSSTLTANGAAGARMRPHVPIHVPRTVFCAHGLSAVILGSASAVSVDVPLAVPALLPFILRAVVIGAPKLLPLTVVRTARVMAEREIVRVGRVVCKLHIHNWYTVV